MQLTIDAMSILEAVLFVLWTVAMAGVAFWVKRMATDRTELLRQINAISTKLEDFRVSVARDYASRAEVKDERDETRAMCGRIESKINDLYNHVMEKK